MDFLEKSKSPSPYLRELERFQLRPTFWTSWEYLTCIADLACYRGCEFIWLEGEDGICLFPPIKNSGKYDLSVPAWAVPSDQPVEGKPTKFLDWEYIFSPNHFGDMSGGKWSVFRKNSRKWPKTHEDFSYYRMERSWGEDQKSLLIKWLGSRPTNEEIQDDKVMIRYLEEGRGFVYGLWYKNQLMGLNCYDYQHAWINFRYSFSDPQEPWLSEFLRLLFYQSKTLWVNDGGTLGNPNLERFKDKLNPSQKSPIYTIT